MYNQLHIEIRIVAKDIHFCILGVVNLTFLNKWCIDLSHIYFYLNLL